MADRQSRVAIYKVSIVAACCFSLLILSVIFLRSGSWADGTKSLVAVGFCCFGLAHLLFLVLLFRAWSLIQDEETATTPRKAVGFLLIPIFNVYWAFKALPGFAFEFNAYVDRHRLPLRRNESGLFMLMPVYGILGSLAEMLARILPMLSILGLLILALYVEAMCFAAVELADVLDTLPSTSLAYDRATGRGVE